MAAIDLALLGSLSADLGSLRKSRGLTLNDLALVIRKSVGWLPQVRRGLSESSLVTYPIVPEQSTSQFLFCLTKPDLPPKRLFLLYCKVGGDRFFAMQLGEWKNCSFPISKMTLKW